MKQGTQVVCINNVEWSNINRNVVNAAGPQKGEVCVVDGHYHKSGDKYGYLYLQGYNVMYDGSRGGYKEDNFVEITVPHVEIEELMEECTCVPIENH